MRVRLVTALLAAALAAGACSDDEPAAGPTLPPITETPSASPTAEAIPTEATAATPEGAAEFAKYFATEVHQAYLTQDSSRIERLSAPGCTTCQAYVDSINQITSQGAKISPGYTVEVVDAQAPALPVDAATARVTVLLRIGEFALIGPDGAELVREAADPGAVQEISLQREGDSWLTAEVRSD